MGEAAERSFNSQEHTSMAKQRALKLLEQGDLKQAIDSLVEDLSKDPTRPLDQLKTLRDVGAITKQDPNLNKRRVNEFIKWFAE